MNEVYIPPPDESQYERDSLGSCPEKNGLTQK